VQLSSVATGKRRARGEFERLQQRHRRALVEQKPVVGGGVVGGGQRGELFAASSAASSRHSFRGGCALYPGSPATGTGDHGAAVDARTNGHVLGDDAQCGWSGEAEIRSAIICGRIRSKRRGAPHARPCLSGSGSFLLARPRER
jgi:hypothetical protein